MESQSLHHLQNAQEQPTENVLEVLSHLDVAEQMKEKNAFFIHMVQVTDQFDVSENNKAIDTKKLSVEDKLDIVYGAGPTLSASTIRPKTADGTFKGGFGVIFTHGEIEHADTTDTGSIALEGNKRHIIGGARNEKEDIERAIDRDQVAGGYNELVLKNPEVGGGFMKLAGMKDRTTYEEEEREYYDGEKLFTKVGVIDFNDPTDERGRPTGGNFNKPFSVLQEMAKRGKVFIMDEANQMYIIRSIDEKTRKVEFIANPITPSDFSNAYGQERMNPYHKKEIKERLEESLKNKGMALH